MTRLLAAFVLQHAVAAAAAKSSDLTCALDATMVNATTFPLIREDLAASLLAGLCGANRGETLRDLWSIGTQLERTDT